MMVDLVDDMKCIFMVVRLVVLDPTIVLRVAVGLMTDIKALLSTWIELAEGRDDNEVAEGCNEYCFWDGDEAASGFSGCDFVDWGESSCSCDSCS
jgi:hypothetical protein